MDRTTLDDVESVPHFMGVNSHRKALAQELEGMDFAATYFELDPGEAFSGGLHTHTDQEELFVVLEGEATWETRPDPGAETETFAVGEGGAVHFEADGVFQQGRNESGAVVRGFAIGVPGARHSWAGVRSLVDCPDCGRETVFAFEDHDERQPDPADLTAACTECGHKL